MAALWWCHDRKANQRLGLAYNALHGRHSINRIAPPLRGAFLLPRHIAPPLRGRFALRRLRQSFVAFWLHPIIPRKTARTAALVLRRYDPALR